MALNSGIGREFENETKTVVVSAVLETTGQVRFGDGTDINITITEKDVVAGPGGGVEKAVFAGTKRRGVDRRAMHELRNRYWDDDCSIPSLCGLCPTCLLLGFTGTTSEIEEIKKIGVNCKSRILYATAYSVQSKGDVVTTHSRNQVNERSQTTAGSAGIHTEEVIVAGTDFPTYTTLHHVLDWEIGAFAHAFLENVNQGRYTAASRAQGGMRFPEAGGEPMVVVDVSEPGIFPLSAPKVPAHKTEFAEVMTAFEGAGSEEVLRESLERFGFSLEENDGCFYVWKRTDSEVGRRYVGGAAVSYLRSRQGDFVDFLSAMKNGGGDAFRDGAREYFAFVSKKKGADE